jgi:hypothetical protein
MMSSFAHELIKLAKVPASSMFMSKDWKTPYVEFLASLNKKTRPIQYGTVHGLPLVKVVTPGSPRMVIISGVHGEEQVGPVTILAFLEDILAYAKSHGVGLTIYPMFSPTGWGRGKRHSVEGKRTNQLVEFEVDGKWKPDVMAGEKYTDVRIAKKATPEAKALFEDILKNDVPVAMLDIHQDSDLDKMDKPPVTYAYVFETGPYKSIAREAGKHLPLAVGTKVELYDGGNNKAIVDRDGLVVSHIDDTTQGAFKVLGCNHSVTIETSLGADPKKVQKVNLVWIKGMIDLVAGKEKKAAPAYVRAAEHLSAPNKDWKKLEKELKNPNFRTEALKLLKQVDDPKLRRYLKNISSYNDQKDFLGEVESRTKPGHFYKIKQLPNRLGCGCKDWQYVHSVKRTDCDHIRAYRAHLGAKKKGR